MLTRPATRRMLRRWRSIREKYIGVLYPNRKSGAQVAQYLAQTLPLRPIEDTATLRELAQEVLLNPPLAEKLPAGQAPDIKAWLVENSGEGARLYKTRERIFRKTPIIAAVDLVTGSIHVEGSGALHDRLCAFQGLDEYDLKNPFLVAQYVECLKKYGPVEGAPDLKD